MIAKVRGTQDSGRARDGDAAPELGLFQKCRSVGQIIPIGRPARSPLTERVELLQTCSRRVVSNHVEAVADNRRRGPESDVAGVDDRLIRSRVEAVRFQHWAR